MTDYLTPKAAEQATAVPEHLILDAIDRGEIPAKTCTGIVVVTLKDVRDYRARELAGGCDGCD